MAGKCHFIRFSMINMSSPSLPMVPQWLEMALGVKQALGLFPNVKAAALLERFLASRVLRR